MRELSVATAGDLPDTEPCDRAHCVSPQPQSHVLASFSADHDALQPCASTWLQNGLIAFISHAFMPNSISQPLPMLLNIPLSTYNTCHVYPLTSPPKHSKNDLSLLVLKPSPCKTHKTVASCQPLSDQNLLIAPGNTSLARS